MIDELVALRVTGHALHDVTLGLLVRERDSRDEVGTEIDAEDSDCAQRKRNVGEDEDEEGGDLRDVAGQSVRN